MPRERVELKNFEYTATAADGSKETTKFAEKVPVGKSGKAYEKSYVSLPEKGGWFTRDKQTGEVTSENPVIGYDTQDTMTREQKKLTMVAIAICPTCAGVYQNSLALEDHCVAAHGDNYQALLEAKRNQEEAAVQAALQGVDLPSTNPTPPRHRGRPKKNVEAQGAP